ncbi:hypothetical protein ASZ78_009460, partial [Callipepla squamata]
ACSGRHLARYRPDQFTLNSSVWIAPRFIPSPLESRRVAFPNRRATAAKTFTLHRSKSPILTALLISTDSRAGEEGAIRSVDHAVVGGVVAVVVFAMLCLLIILGRYFARHKGTYFTHEAKGADDAADADTAIINAEGGQNNSEEKKEYFI